MHRRRTHRAPTKGRSRYLVVLLLIGMVAALALPALAIDGQAGASDVYQCSLVAFPGGTGGPLYEGTGWGNVTAKMMEDGSFWFNVTVHGLMPYTAYQLKSGGVLIATAESNGGGNVHFGYQGTSADGARFNVWESDSEETPTFVRILYTDKACLIPTD